MNTQPIDPRALKAAEEINKRIDELCCLDNEEIARIIQSHLACNTTNPCPAIVALLQDPAAVWANILRGTIARPSGLVEQCVADELAEALRDALGELNPETRASSQRARAVFSGLESVLKRYDAQKGQS